ncbi:hypothetical protein ACFV0W_00570, partial [Streptomyces anulatus]
MDTATNTILTVLLREYGFTHRSLADEVNQVSGRIFGRPGAATDRDVRRWISGAVGGGAPPRRGGVLNSHRPPHR